MIGRLSRYLANIDNLTTVYAVVVVAVAVFGILLLIVSPVDYHDDQLYPKSIDTGSSLNPYDRGGDPFNRTAVVAQYPENSPYLGYVTAYLTPLSAFFAASNMYLGTTIVSHPGGIIDEILYNTRGLDTIAETSILFVAFAIASFLFRREEE
ncbi:NiFe hydrogenase [Methanomicrobiaceae archaeon CYW5]|uniref:DUF2106 family protein n=1 Tax=Methanovulcanius yangii TaxID=1789227 RepID=UPI0029CA3510|nr:DUF2106 family protein [Methanovulcanius yangii]MBT8507354.1 NiFe hydrogenase [Methanovulcanius yangii]